MKHENELIFSVISWHGIGDFLTLGWNPAWWETEVEGNVYHAKFFRGNKNIYLLFMSLFLIDMTQVVEILPRVS